MSGSTVWLKCLVVASLIMSSKNLNKTYKEQQWHKLFNYFSLISNVHWEIFALPPTQMATYSIILAWRILWTEEPGEPQSMGSQIVGHDWATNIPPPKTQDWLQIGANADTDLHFPGFFKAQARAPWPPTEWPKIANFPWSTGKLAFISEGSLFIM